MGHSLSPAMFEAAFWEYNMEAAYERFDVKPVELGDFVKEVRASTGGGLPILGLSVTIPHKEEIMKLLDEVDETAAAIGAVNTVVNKKGKLKGYNTDYFGAVRALEEVCGLEGKRVLIIGAGGAAAAIAYGCRQAGGMVTILNRGVERAKEVADRFGCGYGTLDEILQHPAEVLVHTTSVGMAPSGGAGIADGPGGVVVPGGAPHMHESLVPREYFKRGMVVMDAVYNPLETKLVREAKVAGCRVVPGHKMLVYQAEKQFELWFKKMPATPKMEKALLEALQG